MFGKSALHSLKRRVEAAMTDALRLYVEEEDTSTSDPYDTKETGLYDGKCSVTDDAQAVRRAREGDASFEADALVKLPLIDPFDQEKVKGNVTFGGIGGEGQVTHEGAAVTRVVRKKTHLRLFLSWQDRGQAA